jgi:protein-tyrosine-phosphatase
MTPPLRLLFVCVENSCRSQLAEGFALAAGHEAHSAGSRPSGQVNARAVSAMAELGLDLSGHRSSSVDELPAVHFDAAVTRGCGDACPQIDVRHREDWDIPDPKHMDAAEFRAVRDRVGREVSALIERLGRDSPGS